MGLQAVRCVRKEDLSGDVMRDEARGQHKGKATRLGQATHLA